VVVKCAVLALGGATLGVSVSGWPHCSALWRGRCALGWVAWRQRVRLASPFGTVANLWLCDANGGIAGAGLRVVELRVAGAGVDVLALGGATLGVSVSGWRHRSVLWRICDSVTPTVHFMGLAPQVCLGLTDLEDHVCSKVCSCSSYWCLP
jgi:hypothetical protein